MIDERKKKLLKTWEGSRVCYTNLFGAKVALNNIYIYI